MLLQVLVWKEIRYGRMSEKEKSMLVSEVNILRELKHPNIVRYKVPLASSRMYAVAAILLSRLSCARGPWAQPVGRPVHRLRVLGGLSAPDRWHLASASDIIS